MCKSGICDIKPAISLKRSSLEKSHYRVSINLVYDLSIGDKAGYRELWPTFMGSKFFSQRISRSAHFCGSATKSGNVEGLARLAKRNLFPEFCPLQAYVVRAPRHTMRRHAPVLHWYICKVVFRHLYLCRQFQCSSYSLRCLRIRCKLSLQIPYIASTVLPKRTQSHPIFGACLLGPNGWMDQDATWYGGKPRRRRRVRYRVGTQFPPKRDTAPSFRPGSIVFVGKRLYGRRRQFVRQQTSAQATMCQTGTQLPPPQKGHNSFPLFGPCLLWPLSPISTTAELLQIQDRSPQLRPVASLNQSQTHSDATGLHCGDRSWICNTPP